MLDGLFRPRSIAVIGASNNPRTIGHIVLRNLMDYGFEGPIFPINPRAGHISSIRAYRSVLEVPDDIDLVNISVAARFVPDIIEECGQKGVKFAIVHSAGFKEVGEAGIRREKAMVETAHRYGMRIFGPNSQGIQNTDPEISVYANFTFTHQKPGNISIIAQGGGCGEMLKIHLCNADMGYRMYCSYGNECDLTMPEILEYYGQDDGAGVIMMQIESFKDPAAFLEVASRITPHKPVLALKVGRTREGQVAVSSHTGALVDQGIMTTAMFRKAGVLDFADTDEMVKAALALSGQPVPGGRRIGIVTNTGGPGVQAVDEAIRQGLEMATWSEAGRERLEETQYPEASKGNPVDVVATAGPDQFFAAVDVLLREDGVDMVMVFFVTARFVDTEAIVDRLIEAKSASDKPIVVVIETVSTWQRLIDRLRANSIPVFEFAEDGTRALGAMAQYGVYRARETEPPPELSVDRGRAETILDKYEGSGRYLPQTDAFELLSTYGIPVPRIARVSDADVLSEAARGVGFPCVLKADAADLVHKSDEGGVVLDIGSPEALEQAFEAMQDRFSGRGAEFILQEQCKPGLEVILGIIESPGLGSLVMFGLGGVFVEVMKDVVFALCPLSRLEAREMIRSIKGYPLLSGVRGQPGVDQDALLGLLTRVSRLAADFPGIVEMDLNPVFAYPEGTAPIAVDVRLKVR